MTPAEPAETEPLRAAGVIARSLSGRVHRVDDGSWSWPGGRLKEGETPEDAALRGFFEETGRRLSDAGIKDGVDTATFIADVASSSPRP